MAKNRNRVPFNGLQVNVEWILFCFSFMFICAQSSYAQNRTLSVNIDHGSFESFVLHVEQQSNYKFYYDRTLTDSITVSLRAELVPIEELLDQILPPYNLWYAIDPNNRVFITSEYPLITAFPKAAADTTRAKEAVARSLPQLTDYIDTVKAVDISIDNHLFEIGTKGGAHRGARTLTGYVRGIHTGVPIALASVKVEGHNISVQTDQFGYFSITIPEERGTITISSVGKKETRRQLLMHTSGRLDIDMEDQMYALKEVIVSAEQGSNVRRTQMGVEKLSIETIKQTPTVFGEVDIVKVILTLPGVQTVGEAASGFNVRGGATDQNLVLFNDATIYNPAHFFGFFSAFSPDAVSNVELYKSSVPARFGGRLSSVLDVSAKEGNKNKFSGSGGIGLLTSRLSFDGPIGEKTSFLVGGRSTYSDWLLQHIPGDDYKNSSASFYDINLNINHQANEKNAFYLGGYFSNDRFSFDSTEAYGYQNKNINVKWKRIFSNEVYGTLVTGYDGYQFNVDNDANELNANQLKYQIEQGFIRADIYQQINEGHRLSYGLHTIGYKLHPGMRMPVGAVSMVNADVLEQEQALESALHLSDVYQVNDLLTLDLGLRYAMFNYLGPRSVNYYAPNLPLSENTIIDTRAFGSGQLIKTYHAPEFRLAARYTLSPNSSIKAGYNSFRQYIHMLSNTTAITPTDTWKLSDSHIKPQRGDQASLGYYRDFKSSTIETSVETYYKRMDDYLDYKSGAVLLMNHNVETDVINTEARAYGIEVLVKKLSGKLNGWASYTFSKVEQRTVDVDPADMINNGAYYPSNFDKPHSFDLVGNYKFSHRLSFSLNLTYSTGRPITLPIARFYYAGSERVYYSERNQYRIPDFFRADASFNIEGNHKVRKLAHSSWTVGVYNVTGRRNPYSVYFNSEGGQINGYRLSVFGHQIPFVTYNFRF